MATITAEHQAMMAPQPPTGLASRALGQVRQFICGLHGHDSLLHFEKGRLSLHCVSCGYETPGWDLKTESPRTHLGETRTRMHVPLVSQRHVA